MKYLAKIDVMPLKELLDPEGKTVANNMKYLDMHTVEDVRIGKHIEMTFEAENKEEAEKMVDLACKKLLSNVIMESFTYELTSLN